MFSTTTNSTNVFLTTMFSTTTSSTNEFLTAMFYKPENKRFRSGEKNESEEGADAAVQDRRPDVGERALHSLLSTSKVFDQKSEKSI